MKYVIAQNKAILREGWKPASPDVKDGYSVVNENELRYRYTGMTLEDSAARVGGIIVSRQGASDFMRGRKTIVEIKNNKES